MDCGPIECCRSIAGQPINVSEASNRTNIGHTSSCLSPDSICLEGEHSFITQSMTWRDIFGCTISSTCIMMSYAVLTVLRCVVMRLNYTRVIHDKIAVRLPQCMTSLNGVPLTISPRSCCISAITRVVSLRHVTSRRNCLLITANEVWYANYKTLFDLKTMLISRAAYN